MQTAARSIHTLKIDGMKGDTCVKKVTHALKDVKDISTKSIKVGIASIDSTQEGCDDACKAISSMGFKTREAKAGLNPTGEPLKMNSALRHEIAATKPAAKKK